MARTLSNDQHERIIVLNREGRTMAAISRMIPCSRESVKRHLMEADVRALTYKDDPLIDIDIKDDESLAKVLVKVMEHGRGQEKTGAVMAILKLRAEQSTGNPASEPMTEEEDKEYKRYLREDVYPDLCESCQDAAVRKQVEMAS